MLSHDHSCLIPAHPFFKFKREADSDASYERFHSVLSLLSYLMKAPLVPPGTPVVNALGAQRQVIQYMGQ
jgi:Myo-inositol-1-phosphate synthase